MKSEILDTIVTILKSNDTNYVVGAIVVILSANILHKKEKNQFHLDKIEKVKKIVINSIFLCSIIVISSENYVLAGIISIIFISINV